MKILKLHGHKSNTGGIVNLQNSLLPHIKCSADKYLHYRTGKKQSSTFLSNPIIRIFDQFISFIWYPFYLMIHKPKVVEVNSSLVPNAFKRDFIYAKLTKIFSPKSKLILFNHGWDYEFKKVIAKKQQKKAISYFSTFDIIIVLANQFKKELINEFNVESEKIHVITTGINISEYSSYRISNNDNNKVNILFLSRIEKTKGIEELINAMPKVIQKFPTVHFNIAGTGAYLNKIKNHNVSIQYKTNITFNGYVRDIQKFKLFQQQNIFVFPSYYGEGCPVSVLEAIAVGLPIIYTEVGALPDILEDNKNGILIQKESVSELEEALIKLIEQKELREKFYKNNIELSKNFDLSIIQNQLDSIYKK